jgi:uncharacterized protein YcbX
VATLAPRGGLHFDRAFAMVDAAGAYVNGKREPRVHELRVRYDAALTMARFVSPRLAHGFSFAFEDGTAALEAWLGEHFERPIRVQRDFAGGFPDDTQAPGPTIVSSASLTEVASWFPGLTPEGVRNRLRANIEIGGVPAFWEDGLYAAAGDAVAFRVGAVVLEGTNPCARCVVPSRDPLTGETIPAFSKIFSERRAATLPPWAERSRFDHFYRLTVNTRAAAAPAGGLIAAGDVLERLVASRR